MFSYTQWLSNMFVCPLPFEQHTHVKNEQDHTGAKSDLNQYWYSSLSIQKMVEEVRAEAKQLPLRVCFVSTPSLFFRYLGLCCV